MKPTTELRAFRTVLYPKSTKIDILRLKIDIKRDGDGTEMCFSVVWSQAPQRTDEPSTRDSVLNDWV